MEVLCISRDQGFHSRQSASLIQNRILKVRHVAPQGLFNHRSVDNGYLKEFK